MEEVEHTNAVLPVNKPKILSVREREQLIKIAFRNYIDLISVADKKAGLLIQVNSISVSLAFGLIINKWGQNDIYYLPVSIILLSSLVTIFYSVLASQPRISDQITSKKELFFFGSFDRLEPAFKSVSWEKYVADMRVFFKGSRKDVFSELMRESFDARNVLSLKFSYLSTAYKIFFGGLLLGTLSFMLLYFYNRM